MLAEAARASGGAGVGLGLGGGGLRGVEERLMNSHEADILVAFLGLFRCDSTRRLF